jgi:hypothetical protein
MFWKNDQNAPKTRPILRPAEINEQKSVKIRSLNSLVFLSCFPKVKISAESGRTGRNCRRNPCAFVSISLETPLNWAITAVFDVGLEKEKGRKYYMCY